MKSYKQHIEENLRKDIAQLSAKFPEGSKVRCKKSGKTGKVLTVGKDFVKVAVDGGKDVDYKPNELESLEESTKAYAKSQEKIADKKKKDKISASDKDKLAKLSRMMRKEDAELEEETTLVKAGDLDLADGSKVKVSDKDAAMLNKMFAKTDRRNQNTMKKYIVKSKRNYNDMLDLAMKVKESIELEEDFVVYKNRSPLLIKGKEVRLKTKAAAEKTIATLKTKPFNKDAQFTIVKYTSDKEWNAAQIRRKQKYRPSWRQRERGE